MEKLKGIRAVVFDLDGTLINTEVLYRRFWLEAAHQMGYPMEERHTLMIRSCSPEVAGAILRREVQPDFDYFAVRDLRRKLMKAYLDEYGVEPKPGMKEALLRLRDRGMRIGLATQSPLERARQCLTQVGVLDLFDILTTGDQVRHGKPDPEIYLTAIDQLRMSKEEVLAVEDAPTGVRAAAASGARCALIPDLDQPGPEITSLCALVVPDLLTLTEMLD